MIGTEAEDGIICNTYKFIIFLWNQDVHLRALGADDVTVEGFLAQVDLAALCLVDGNGGNFSQNLQGKITIRKVWLRTTLPTTPKHHSLKSDTTAFFLPVTELPLNL